MGQTGQNLLSDVVVDDFAIKYVDKADVDHLLICLREKYPVKEDWDAQQYIGINLDWNYTKGEVLLSMKDYVQQALKQFKHEVPKQLHYGPSKVEAIQYGEKVQYSHPIDNRPITKEQHKFIQQVTGKFLFYVRAVDPTMLHALNCIACGGGYPSQLGCNKLLPKLCRQQPRGPNHIQKK